MPLRPVQAQVVNGLKIAPEFGGSPKGVGQQPGGVGRNTPFAFDDFVNPLHRNLQMGGQCPLCNFQRLKKFFLEDDSGMSRSSVGWNHIFLPICLVIVHDFDIISVGSYPAKHDAPLGIDSNAVKSVEIAMESFQPVSGRHSKIIQTGSGV